MSRAAAFRQADAARSLRVAIAAGLKPSGFTIAPDGSIKVEFGEGGSPLRQVPSAECAGVAASLSGPEEYFERRAAASIFRRAEQP